GVVTSSWQRDTVVSQYDIDPVKIRVIPNYVVTDVFQPQPEVEKQYDLVSVGRAGKQKNLGNLLQALHSLKTKGKRIRMVMVGGCSYDNEIKEAVERYALDVTFAGNIPNLELPSMLNQAKVYILASYYEGHPKTLLEAMSCGLPCIGTDVTGIREDIQHKKTGYLCGTDYESIANAIETVLSDEALKETMGKSAQEYVQRNYSVDKVLEMELDVIREVIAQ
ncbi:MAG: glycosyltransferase family 4 protein, partial [Desulfobacterales bacterium]|nr:glycosyltransferase family 4 protein [Desulfobacterales bacterium]